MNSNNEQLSALIEIDFFQQTNIDIFEFYQNIAQNIFGNRQIPFHTTPPSGSGL